MCHHAPSMGSNRTLIALSISGCLFFSCSALGPFVSPHTERKRSKMTVCWMASQMNTVPEARERRQPVLSQLHCCVTLPALLFFFFPLLIITKPHQLFEGGPLIKVVAAPDATTRRLLPLWHRRRLTLNQQRRSRGLLNPNLQPLQRTPNPRL